MHDIEDMQMGVEHKTVGGEKSGVGGPICFEPIDDVREEMLEPIWSELDVFSSGDVNGLLSSEILVGGPTEMDAEGHRQVADQVTRVQRTTGCKVKEEFAQQGTLHVGVTTVDKVPMISGHMGILDSHQIDGNVGIANFGIPDSVMEAEFASLAQAADSHDLSSFQCSYGMDSKVASFLGVENTHDKVDMKGTHQSSDDGFHGLGLPGGVVFDGSIGQTKEKVLSEELDKGVLSLEIVDGGAELSENGEKAILAQSSKIGEDLSKEEELEKGFVAVERVNQNSHGIINIQDFHGVEQEMLGLRCVETEKMVTKQEVDREDAVAEGFAAIKENLEMKEFNKVEATRVSTVEKVQKTRLEDAQEETMAQACEVDNEKENNDPALVLVDSLQPKVGPGIISEMTRDGILSAEGLASKGFVFVDDDESESDEDGDSDESSEDEEESDESSSADSVEEDGMEPTKKVSKRKEVIKDAEDTGPLRTKHELDVLPSVPKVTAVLEPHHKTVSVGNISSVLDVTVIVGSSGSQQRILNENSVLWLTDSRVPLGIVDEVFGPVKNPFYLVRFNELSEVPEDAKIGADVSYVSEFSEFVLKENPSLYRKAVDASGLDDEELPSDEDLEFSDDEKEAAARLREKSKRGLDVRENRPGQDRNPAENQHSKGQRTERGRGRGHGGGRGAALPSAVDSAAGSVAGMDLQGSPLHLPGSGSKQQNGRKWTRGRQQSSPRNSGHQELWMRGSGTGPATGTMSLPHHQESPQRRDYFAEQGSQMQSSPVAQQVRQASGLQCTPFDAAAVPMQMQGQGALLQQPTTGFQSFGYHNVPVHDSQFGISRQGSFFQVPSGPQFIQNPGVFSSPNLHSNAYFNMQGQGQMNMICNPGYGPIVHTGVHHSPGGGQGGGHPSHLSFMVPTATFGGGMVAPDLRAQSIPQRSQNQGPVGLTRASRSDQRGHHPGYYQRSYSDNKGS